MKKIVQFYIPNYGKIMTENKKSFRNQTNSWIIENIHEVKSRKKYDKINQNSVSNLFYFNKFYKLIKEFLILFRLLTIKYRAKYPLKGTSMNIDKDLQISLENKICNAFLRYGFS